MPNRHTPSFLSSLLFLLPAFTHAISLDCSSIVADKTKFNLKALHGPHSLHKIYETPPLLNDYTFTLDICRPLKKAKGVPKDEDCPNGSRVCATEQINNTIEDTSVRGVTVPIAGEFEHTIGGALDPKWTRLKNSASNTDRQKEGLRLEMNGGSYEKQDQKAIIEFLCPKSAKKANRRDEFFLSKEEDDKKNDEDKGEDGDKEDKKHEGELVDDGQGGTLEYVSWKLEGGAKTLRLLWQTEYACEDSDGSDGSDGSDNKSSSNHWGFFTWFIIIVFLGIATYLIFGSWLNYNRLGTRGFDVVPHADTIRDLPYLFRDWMRRVVDTVQGGHSRAGYSAV